MMNKRHLGRSALAIIFSFLFILPTVTAGEAATPAATTKIEHKMPGKKYFPGFRINLDVKISDEAGLLATRCYFKTKNDKNFAFVDLFHRDGNHYRATLPAPFVNSEEVNYLFVVVNEKKQVSRTKVYTMEEEETKEAIQWKDINDVKEVRLDRAQNIAEKYVSLYNQSKKNYVSKLSDYQSPVNDVKLQVKTELPRNQVPLKGFYDLATITEVPAAAKFGFLAENLYSSEAIAAGGGSEATNATSAGIISTSSGLSTTTMIGIAGVAVIGAGVAIAAGSGGGGGGGGGGGTPPQPGQPLTPTSILGHWNYAGQRFDGVSRSGQMDFNNNGTFSWTMADADHQSDGSGTGNWTLSGSNLVLNFITRPTWNGTANGNSQAFDFLNTGHGNYHFSR